MATEMKEIEEMKRIQQKKARRKQKTCIYKSERLIGTGKKKQEEDI